VAFEEIGELPLPARRLKKDASRQSSRSVGPVIQRKSVPDASEPNFDPQEATEGSVQKSVLQDEELIRLDRLANGVILCLAFLSLSSFSVGAYLLATPQPPLLITELLIGFAGSAVAALTSCLDRYAVVGFERENGKSFPEDATPGKGKFNRRFARWLLVRPLLGAIVAPVFIWGISHFSSERRGFVPHSKSLGFTAFAAGLLAKSVLDLVKNLFKNVFWSMRAAHLTAFGNLTLKADFGLHSSIRGTSICPFSGRRRGIEMPVPVLSARPSTRTVPGVS
jgi:hypothetical protein